MKECIFRLQDVSITAVLTIRHLTCNKSEIKYTHLYLYISRIYQKKRVSIDFQSKSQPQTQYTCTRLIESTSVPNLRAQVFRNSPTVLARSTENVFTSLCSFTFPPSSETCKREFITLQCSLGISRRKSKNRLPCCF